MPKDLKGINICLQSYIDQEKTKIDKYVPNRYIPKIGDNGKIYRMLETIAINEFRYIQIANKNDSNPMFNETKNVELNIIRQYTKIAENDFKNQIFKGIKSDIDALYLYRHK
jgi:hypothetical protein